MQDKVRRNLQFFTIRFSIFPYFSFTDNQSLSLSSVFLHQSDILP